ncbi:MAG: histidine ammonia-lyase [Myxococcales bacterium]|nr:MAG: histidine ammonia-lyase [Myxococcales bacterium]
MERVRIDGESLTLEQVEAVARRGAKVELAPDAVRRMERSRAFVDEILREGRVVYGVNTGFGVLSDVRIDAAEIEQLQVNLIRSHSIGVGEPLPAEGVRAMMLLRANVVAKGYSGVRVLVVQRLLDLLNAGVHPIIPEKGSVGASGDLAPLAHLTLAMLGEGEAEYKGKRMPAKAALKKAGLVPIALAAKEGLALINGTQAMTGIGALAQLDAERLATLADVVGAMDVEALLASAKPFDARVQKLRAHPGQAASAANLRKLLRGSAIVKSHKNCGKVQDAYSLRCMPQVHGATRDALAYSRRVLTIEANAATDNPLLFPEDGDVISGGNFHGQPVALALDFAAIAVAEIADISERRVEQLVNPALSSNLPAFLIEHKGLNSGFMIAQVAAASLVSENKILAHPASVDSIPSSAGREDHVSMGTIAARKFREIVRNVQAALAIEFLCAAQGLDFRKPLVPSKGPGAALKLIRKRVPFLHDDRVLYQDHRRILGLIQSGELLAAVEAAVGSLA